MKRVICACALLMLVAATTVFSMLTLRAHFDVLEDQLSACIGAYANGDPVAAEEALDRFDAVIEQNKLFLHLFVRRDLLYSLENANATLRDYMPEETKYDFYAEARRALEQLYAVEDTLFYIV